MDCIGFVTIFQPLILILFIIIKKLGSLYAIQKQKKMGQLDDQEEKEVKLKLRKIKMERKKDQ